MDEIGAVILAGGRSSRFGRDKAGVQLDGLSLLEHVLNGLPESRAETILVLREDQAEPGFPVDQVVLDDPALPAGPLRGIVSGLEAMTSGWAWVVACDLPGIMSALLEDLARARTTNALGVIPEWGGRIQPLCALYSHAALPILREAAGSSARSVTGALDKPGFLRFEEARCRKFDPEGRSFININTPDALERFRSAP
jgi:molybdopterin-guanine dinucleotide biosynthesis protein A